MGEHAGVKPVSVKLGGVAVKLAPPALYELFSFQKRYQKALGLDPRSTESLRYYVLCLVDEAMELLHEVPHWKKHRPSDEEPDRERVAEECADALVFLVNVMVGCGISPGEFEAAIWRTMEKNKRRLAEGVNKTSA